MQKLLKKPLKITGLDSLCTVHRFIFDDLYSWAGGIRQNYDLHKRTNGMDFYAQPAATIPTAWRYINTELVQPLLNRDGTTYDYMELLDNINTLHPFREGNGRATKIFLQLLAKQNGQYLHFPRYQDQLIVAMNNADYRAMTAQFVPTQDTEQNPFDDQVQTIAGLALNQPDYRIIKDSILFNMYEGWQPTKAELVKAVENYQHCV